MHMHVVLFNFHSIITNWVNAWKGSESESVYVLINKGTKQNEWKENKLVTRQN